MLFRYYFIWNKYNYWNTNNIWYNLYLNQELENWIEKDGPIEFSLNIKKKKKYLKNKVHVEKCIMSNNLKQKIIQEYQ